MEALENSYNGFRKMIIFDYPYEIEINDGELFPTFSLIYKDILNQHSKIKNKFFSKEGKGIIDFRYLDHYLIVCFRVANYIYKNMKNIDLAEAIYYSSKIRTSTDLYYTTEIGEYFMPCHSIGAVIDSRAQFGKLFKVYNGVHMGPHNINGIDPKEWKHPRFGNGVTLLANSSVYGDTVIEDNVIVSSNSLIINEKIPANCIVIGQSPSLYILPNNFNNIDLIDNF